MTIAVDLGRKATKPTNYNSCTLLLFPVLLNGTNQIKKSEGGKDRSTYSGYSQSFSDWLKNYNHLYFTFDQSVIYHSVPQCSCVQSSSVSGFSFSKHWEGWRICKESSCNFFIQITSLCLKPSPHDTEHWWESKEKKKTITKSFSQHWEGWRICKESSCNFFIQITSLRLKPSPHDTEHWWESKEKKTRLQSMVHHRKYPLLS